SNERGDFAFRAVPPGSYTVKVELVGFKPIDRRNNVLSASGQLDLGHLTLEVGNISEVVIVASSGAHVETKNSDYSGLLTGNQVTVDGLNGNELSGTDKMNSSINLDAIAEVKVLMNTYKAEYGHSAGANIEIVTKSGTQNYHGSGYWYGRRDRWNATPWENERAGLPKPKQKVDTPGFNLGGPVKLPGQAGEKKLFFFY